MAGSGGGDGSCCGPTVDVDRRWPRRRSVPDMSEMKLRTAAEEWGCRNTAPVLSAGGKPVRRRPDAASHVISALVTSTSQCTPCPVGALQRPRARGAASLAASGECD